MTTPARYDHERNQWVPQCPYGDVCTGCDAAGKCSRTLLDDLRRIDAERWREIGAQADADCRICRGRGSTRGYVSPGVYETYACPCTGMADWQVSR